MDWSADEVSRELRSAPDLAARSLTELHAAGLLAQRSSPPPASRKDGPAEPRYRFAPATTAQVRTVEMIARLYRERRYTVLDLIYAEPPVDNIKAFSDAFRLRREDD